MIPLVLLLSRAARPSDPGKLHARGRRTLIGIATLFVMAFALALGTLAVLFPASPGDEAFVLATRAGFVVGTLGLFAACLCVLWSVRSADASFPDRRQPPTLARLCAVCGWLGDGTQPDRPRCPCCHQPLADAPWRSTSEEPLLSFLAGVMGIGLGVVLVASFPLLGDASSDNDSSALFVAPFVGLGFCALGCHALLSVPKLLRKPRKFTSSARVLADAEGFAASVTATAQTSGDGELLSSEGESSVTLDDQPPSVAPVAIVPDDARPYLRALARLEAHDLVAIVPRHGRRWSRTGARTASVADFRSESDGWTVEDTKALHLFASLYDGVESPADAVLIEWLGARDSEGPTLEDFLAWIEADPERGAFLVAEADRIGGEREEDAEAVEARLTAISGVVR